MCFKTRSLFISMEQTLMSSVAVTNRLGQRQRNSQHLQMICLEPIWGISFQYCTPAMDAKEGFWPVAKKKVIWSALEWKEKGSLQGSKEWITAILKFKKKLATRANCLLPNWSVEVSDSMAVDVVHSTRMCEESICQHGLWTTTQARVWSNLPCELHQTTGTE